MADMLTEYKPNRPLRSVGSSQLEIPRVHTKLLDILPTAVVISFQKRSDVLKHKPHLNPDSKLICLAVHLLNKHCATSKLIALYIIIFYS